VSDAGELLQNVRGQLAAVEDALRDHPFLAALEHGHLPQRALRAFAGEQRLIIASDRHSFEHLAARFTQPPAGDFFLTMADGEAQALRLLEAFLEPEPGYEPQPGCQAYPAYVAWLALNGSRSDVTLAFLANLTAWGASCKRIAAALRDRYDVSFFEFFATPPGDFDARALTVLDAGLADGDSPIAAARAARLLQAYELLYWDSLGATIH